MSELKEEVLAGAELAVEAFIEKAYGPVADELIVKLKELIPGETYDGIADLLGAALKPAVKDVLLAQAEKISKQV